MTEREREIYRLGFRGGLRAYAWWKDGVQMVGSCGATLREAIQRIESTWNYAPGAADRAVRATDSLSDPEVLDTVVAGLHKDVTR